MAADNGRPRRARRTVYLETFGCQMNELDSELVRGQLAALGYTFTDRPREADVVLYNTCSVRQQAENKVLSRVGRVGRWKKKEDGTAVVLGLIGCLAEREGSRLLSRYPQIDLLCGPGELDRLPMLIDNALKTEAAMSDRVALAGSRSRRSSTLAAAEDNLELLDLSRSFDPDLRGGSRSSAYVRITRGCNKFCTYCVVPYTRGPEVHRPPDHIVAECRRLADRGALEITLLGQTVNHYLYTHGIAVTVAGRETAQIGPGGSAFVRKNRCHALSRRPRPQDAGVCVEQPGKACRSPDFRPHASPGPGGPGRSMAPELGSASRRVTTFADLLRRIHDEVPAIRRLRFVTSYPRDFGDDVLGAMAECPRICRYLHAPAQSGSDRILKLMNRGYCRGEYLEFVDRARHFLPDVMLAGDIIVGFPTETDEDFELTRDLLRRVRFKNNFIFKYSRRPGTAAARRLPDDVPAAIKRSRNNELLALQAGISAEVHASLVGRTVDVFVEGVSRKSAPHRGAVELRWEAPRVQMTGRTPGDLITVFELPQDRSPQELTGTIVPVEIMGSGPLILQGRLLEGCHASAQAVRAG